MKIDGLTVPYIDGFYDIPVLHVDGQGLATKCTYLVHVHDGQLCPYHDCDAFVIEPNSSDDYRLSRGGENGMIVPKLFLDKLAAMLKFELPSPVPVA